MRLLKHLDHRKIACDVDEELRFHVEMLQQKYTRHGMSPAEAKAAAQKRFGNFQRVKNQCVQISRRNRPLQQLLKTLSIILGCSGLLIWVLSADYKVTRIGTILIFIAISSRVLLYVRGLSPSTPHNQRSITIHNAKP